MNSLKLCNEKGQTLTEYAIILLLIALVVAASLPPMATVLAERYTSFAAVFP